MLCEWGRVRGEHPPPILAREPRGSRALIFNRHPFVSALGSCETRNLEPRRARCADHLPRAEARGHSPRHRSVDEPRDASSAATKVARLIP